MSRMLLTGAMVGSLTTATAMSLFGFGSKEKAKPVSVTPKPPEPTNDDSGRTRKFQIPKAWLKKPEFDGKQKPEPVVPKRPCVNCRGPPSHPSYGCPEGQERLREIAEASYIYNRIIQHAPNNNPLVDHYYHLLKDKRSKVTANVTYELIISNGFINDDHSVKGKGKYFIYEYYDDLHDLNENDK